MDQKKNIVIIILSVLVVILFVLVVLFATNIIVFNDNSNVVDKGNDKNEINNDQVFDNDSNDAKIYYGLENKEWIDYLKSKDMVIKMSEYNYEEDECQYKEITLLPEQIDNIIDELSMSKITKIYYGYYPGGWACLDNFILEYEGIDVGFDSSGHMLVTDDNVLSNKMNLDKDYVVYNFGAEEENFNFFYELDINFKDIVDKYR